MTLLEIQSLILARPAAISWSTTEAEKKKAIEHSVDMALNMIASSFDWPFIMDDFYETATSAQTYTLKGRKNDARDIVNVRYGSTKNLLYKYTPVEADEALSGSSSTSSSPTHWIRLGDNNGFPQIEIVGTVTAGDLIYYRFRRTNLTIGMFPDPWTFVLVSAIEKLIFGTVNVVSGEKGIQAVNPAVFHQQYQRDLNLMKDDYSRGGGEDQGLPVTRAMKQRNRSRNALPGY